MRTRPGAVLALVAVLVVALAVVAAVVAANRDRPQLDPAAPDGVVQLYLAAIFDGDVTGAVAHLDPALGCGDPLPEVYVADVARIAVTRSDVAGDTASVRVRIEEGTGLDGGWSHQEDFTLRRTDGTWLITGNPWPIHSCERWVD